MKKLILFVCLFLVSLGVVLASWYSVGDVANSFELTYPLNVSQL